MKEFDIWNKLKKKLDDRKIKFFYKEREIRWCNIGVNVGKEIDGKDKYFARPVLVLKKFNKHSCLIIPLTTTHTEGDFLKFIIIEEKIQKLNFAQLKVISSKRLNKKITTLNKDLFRVVQNDFKNIYF